jgi:hypothetical protein
MSPASRRIAGILLIVIPTVMYGSLTLLQMLVGDPSYMANPLRQNLWRAGHAHVGVLLVLSLVMLRYVDEARLRLAWRHVARLGVPLAAILMPAGFFLSMVSPHAVAPNGLLRLVYLGGASLALGVVTLGIGLVRPPA